MIRSIEECRDLALAVLRPSKSQLEHGLELHRDSLVWDSYGFAPGVETDAGRIGELVSDNCSRNERTILREHYTHVDGLNAPEVFKKYREMWEAAGVDCVFQNAGVEGNKISNLLFRLAHFVYMPDRYPEFYRRAAFPADVLAAKAAGKRALYLTTNGVPLEAYPESAEFGTAFIKVFFQLGVRMMHLTYNRRNLIGDGCAEAANAGLSDFGKMVIAEMNKVGVIPDIAHSGQRTSLEAALCSTKPVVASHAVAGALSTHYRGKSDEVIRALAKSGGYIGICAWPAFFRGSGYIDSFLDHIDYVAENFGVDHVAIGTDHGDLVPNPSGLPAVTGRASKPIFEQYWSPASDEFTPTAEMFDSVAWCNWPLFTVGLVQRGYSDDDIRKIIGGNVLRVATETLK